MTGVEGALRAAAQALHDGWEKDHVLQPAQSAAPDLRGDKLRPGGREVVTFRTGELYWTEFDTASHLRLNSADP
jgi:hypothetical protein